MGHRLGHSADPPTQDSKPGVNLVGVELECPCWATLPTDEHENQDWGETGLGRTAVATCLNMSWVLGSGRLSQALVSLTHARTRISSNWLGFASASKCQNRGKSCQAGLQ